MSTGSWSVLLGSAVAVLVFAPLTTLLLGYAVMPADAVTQAAPAPDAKPAVLLQPAGELLAFRPPVGRRWGLRRSPVCPIAPGADDEPLLSETPTFVWAEKITTGTVKKVAVVLNDGETEVWSQTLSASATPASSTSGWSFHQVSYGGEALQANQEYRWIMFDALDREIISIPFQIMDSAQREPLKTALQELEDRLCREGKTAEEIAWQQANYLADNQLWSDALQVAFSVETPSAELAAWRNQIPDQLCGISE